MDAPSLDAALLRAPDVTAACRAAVASLAGDQRLSAAVYLRRGGRLRCQAAAGVAHVRDGLPLQGTTVGSALESAEAQLRHAPGGPPCEIALPIVDAGGAGIGGPLAVLHVESPDGVTEKDLFAAQAVARQLGRRIGELGGPPADSAVSRLAHHVAALTTLEDPALLERAALVAALDLAGMESALLLRRDPDGELRARCAAGPLSSVLMTVSPASATALDALVAGGASCATVPDAPGQASPQWIFAALRDVGAQSAAVVALRARPAPSGVLLLADSRSLALASDRLELLELIGAQAATSLRALDAVADLRRRAATDPLTGLGHRGTFEDALARAHQRPVATAVAICDVDRFKELNDREGHQRGDHVLLAVSVALQRSLRRGDTLFRLGGDEFAALLAVRDDAEALAATRRMHAAVGAAQAGVSVSIGVAVPGPGEPDDELVGRADAALYATKDSGRDGVTLAPPSERDTAAAPTA